MRIAATALSVLLVVGVAAAQEPSPKPPETLDAEPRPTSRPIETRADEAPAPADPPPTEPGEKVEEPEALPPPITESDFDHAACRLALFQLGAKYSVEPTISDPDTAACGITRPIKLTEVLPGITLEGGADMRCDTARALAHWMGEIVVPSAGRLPGSTKITSLKLGTTYHCRGVVGNGTPQNLSEHAVGNAIDIAAFGFDDGSEVVIAPPADRGDLAIAFQNAVQGAACMYFTTVLGPGSNAAHADHLHLDIKQRRGGFRLCQ